jgi:O-acetyl-ADP-ribose deacetylase (regulator of RNase III)
MNPVSEGRMGTISYLKGDATAPQGKGTKIICHVCNDAGGWGKGFVLALSKRWDEPETAYREWYNRGDGFALGAVRFVQVGPYLWVANLIGQRGTKTGSSGPPVRYGAIAAGLKLVSAKALELGASVHMPRIGCGLAGGEWSEVEPLVNEHLVARGVPVTVYDFDK